MPSASTTPRSRVRTVKVAEGCSYSYQLPWDGHTKLKGTLQSPIGFDTETELIVDNRVPGLALAVAAAGGTQYLIHPGQLAAWVLLHAGEHLVGHNVSFDFWVVREHLLSAGAEAAEAAWWRTAGDGRLHDTMLLDMLVRLARAAGFEAGADDSALTKRNLDEVARDHAGLRVDKSDPFRLRYAEVIGVPWESVTETGFWDYAVRDGVVTHLTWRSMYRVALGLFQAARKRSPRDVWPDCLERFGPLTESLQVRADIALQAMQRRGIHVDRRKAAGVEASLREEAAARTRQMIDAAAEVFRWKEPPKPPRALKYPTKTRQGPPAPPREPPPPLPRVPENLVLTPKGGTPSMRTAVLKDILQATADAGRYPAPQSDGKTGGVSASAKAWARYAKGHPFIEPWVRYSKLTKMIGFFANFHDNNLLHPRYNVLMRTGRTSCTRPNIQQMPRDANFRELFVPRAGYKMLTIDYSFIELRTLAVVCEQRFGSSVLGDVIRQGIDPHAYTAAMVLGIPVEEFLSWKKSPFEDLKRVGGKMLSRPDAFKEARQAAKAINFGVPGGLGPPKLAAYARANYGVEMSVEEAAVLRWKLVHDVYPELELYLADDTFAAMAHNLNVAKVAVLQTFGVEGEEEDRQRRMARAVCKVLRGNPVKADGTPYKPRFVDRVWQSVRRLAGRTGRIPTSLKQAITDGEGSPALEKLFCCGPAVTLTGRVRGSATYTQARNTPFQGLAADGAKLSMWKLLEAGFYQVGFLHDEVLVEVPESTAEADALRVDRLLCEGMAEVLNNTLPIAAEGHVGDFWQKG